MRKAIFLAAAALFLTGCGDDKTTDGNGQDMEISVTVSPAREIVAVSDTLRFTAFVFGATVRDVSWQVQDSTGGNTEFGTIDEEGLYTAPATEPGIDSVKVSAVSVEDPSKSGTSWVILIDPTKVYVSISGSDTDGIGSRSDPYRTITFAITQADIDQIVIVGAGEYDLEGGETFPIELATGAKIRGVGNDSTYVIGPGGSHDESGAVFSLDGDAITLERLNISTADFNGVGVWLLPGIQTRIKNNHIVSSYFGIYAGGSFSPRPFIESNTITGDSIGIGTGESAEPIIRENQITDCGIYGLHILDLSKPDLGTNNSTDAGQNIIQNCGQYLIHNASPDTIWAVGNSWDLPNPIDNDQFIYDDDENPGLSGPVILENQ
jgi:hypothetical protein